MQKSVLITGVSTGIGYNLLKVYYEKGYQIFGSIRKQGDQERLLEEFPNFTPLLFDVTDDQAIADSMKIVTKQLAGKGLDLLINNAGVIEPISHLSAADPEAWGHVIDINLKGVFNGMRAALPVMESAGGGSILTISSGAAHGPVEAWSHYCASKAAVAMLTRCVDLESADKGIRAIGLSPGTVATEMQREIKASGVNPVSQLDWDVHIPADWPARALLWMCSADANDWLGREISLRDEDIRKQVGLI